MRKIDEWKVKESKVIDRVLFKYRNTWIHNEVVTNTAWFG